MQTSDAYVLGRRIKYLDPLAICEAKHSGPNTWKEDHDLFKNCKTHAQIAKERKFHLKEAMKMVVAYIAKMMKKWEDDADVILRHITLGTSTFNHLLQYTLAPIHS